ncbi:hypothetical protein [Corallococcus sp. 4LFB]|uniref:hypothetical protein n=1 Tax=Corallococcus sp. 4LFB TaxID=3383249 RepID=UPI0039766971
MNLARVDEYVEGSEPDRVYLTEVAQGALKELVVGDWLHVEQVEDEVWWMRVGDMRVTVKTPRNGLPEVDVERGFYDMVQGDTKSIEGSDSPQGAMGRDDGSGRDGEE